MTEVKTPAQLADDAAGAIRALNHATLSPRDGWEFPADAYSVVGNLHELAARLPQAIGQLHRFISGLEAAGHLSSDNNTLDRDLVYAYEGLQEAREAAAKLGAALSRAHNGLGSIAYKA
jgi:hypothetical protein